MDRGVATRLKPGLFILVPFEPGKERQYFGNPFVVAREIMNGEDYYISHATAMDIHGMLTLWMRQQDLEPLRNGLTATYVRLDPVLPVEGKHFRRWRLQLNIDPEELRAIVRT